MAEGKVRLKVGIFPWIPDLGKDNLKSLKDLIKYDFESEHPDITLTVSNDFDAYDVDKVVGYLSNKTESYDILEIDTIFLGEVVDKGVVQELNLPHYGLKDKFFPVGLDAVSYQGAYYGVPTLHCANFLIELISGDVPQTKILSSLESGNHDFADLRDVIHRNHKLFKGVSPLVGDFRGNWQLPLMYLDAYIDKHGKASVQEGIHAPIDAEIDVLDNLKWLIDLGDDTDGYNKGERDEYDSASSRNIDLQKSDHILLYGYSEWLSQVMAAKMLYSIHIHASCIVAPPLGAENNLLTFTDALIVNKSHFSDEKKKDAIVKFLQFYVSLKFRNKYAEGVDLKNPHPPRYVLISRKDFYTDGFGADNKNYQKLYEALEYSTAAPNHGLAGHHKKMNARLVQKLNLPTLS